MNWLSLLSEPERRTIVAELARLMKTSAEFAELSRLALEDGIPIFEKAVENVLKKYNLQFTDSTVAEIALNLDRDPVLTTAHGPILDLINAARIAAKFITNESGADLNYLNQGQNLFSAAAAVEAALPKVKL